MFKRLLAAWMALVATVSMAAVDVNKATQADLDGIKGIGPGIAGKILEERKKGHFKDWNDFIERVKGVGESNAAKFSAEGMTINGASFKGAAPVAAKKDDKPAPAPVAAATKKDDKATAAPAAAAKPAPTAAADKKPEAKPEAKADKKDAAKPEAAASAAKK